MMQWQCRCPSLDTSITALQHSDGGPGSDKSQGSLFVFGDGDDILGNELRHALSHPPADVHDHLSVQQR